jgi:hypothetical protein
VKTAFLLVGLVSALTASSAPQRPVEEDPTSYDARVTFARLRYNMGLGADPDFGMGGGSREPPWAHDYPRAERNLMHILAEVTTTDPFKDGGRIIDVGDPELFKYPIAYMSEPGFWQMSDKEAENLRDYLMKGGFIIFDDFGSNRGRDDWQNLAMQMARVLPQARWIPMDVKHPIFHSFFEIESLENLIPSYRGQPLFFGLFEDNDPTKRLLAIANYNNDLGENWEYSDTGFLPVEMSNEAYKFGINYYVYALTH